MNDKIHIIGIAGSLRKNSVNKYLLRAAIELSPENFEIESYDISNIPLYNEDIIQNDYPSSVVDLKEKIKYSDGILIATPEYNYSIPGVLKNMIDWVSRPPLESPFNNKPLAIMGATGGISGTIRAQMHLRQVAVYTNMLVMNKPEIYIQKAGDKFDADGKLTDESTRQHIKKFLTEFASWIKLVSKK
jgi:chromate reductase